MEEGAAKFVVEVACPRISAVGNTQTTRRPPAFCPGQRRFDFRRVVRIVVDHMIPSRSAFTSSGERRR